MSNEANVDPFISFPIKTGESLSELSLVQIDSNGELVAAYGVLEVPDALVYDPLQGTEMTSSQTSVTVRMLNGGGTFLCRAEGTITAGDYVSLAAASGNAGKVSTTTTGRYIGKALSSGVDEGEVLVLFYNGLQENTPESVTLDATTLSATGTLHHNRSVIMNHTAAASTITLPAAAGTGIKIRFVVGAVNTSGGHIIEVANASDVFEGPVLMLQDSADTVVAFESAADSDTITLNGTTTGGAAIGDYVEVEDYVANKWRVSALLTGTGSEATPYSAAV